MPSAPSITFEVRPSRWLVAGVYVMTLAACVAVWLSRLAAGWEVLLCALIGAYAAASVRQLRRKSLRVVGWHADDAWTLHWADGRDGTARLLTARVLGPLIVLRLEWANAARSALILLPDNVDADTRRRLRVRLSAFADSA